MSDDGVSEVDVEAFLSAFAGLCWAHRLIPLCNNDGEMHLARLDRPHRATWLDDLVQELREGAIR